MRLVQALELYEHLAKVPSSAGLCYGKYAACYRLMGDAQQAAAVYQQAYEGDLTFVSPFFYGGAIVGPSRATRLINAGVAAQP